MRPETPEQQQPRFSVRHFEISGAKPSYWEAASGFQESSKTADAFIPSPSTRLSEQPTEKNACHIADFKKLHWDLSSTD